MPSAEEIYENQAYHRRLAQNKYAMEKQVPKDVAIDVVGRWSNDEVTDYLRIPRSGAYCNY